MNFIVKLSVDSFNPPGLKYISPLLTIAVMQ